MSSNDNKDFSEVLMDAALRVTDLSPQQIAKLLMKAAIRLRVIQRTGIKLEHVPVHAYHMLRRLSQGPIASSEIFGKEDEATVAFLISRELISKSADDQVLMITDAGHELGEIADERI